MSCPSGLRPAARERALRDARRARHHTAPRRPAVRRRPEERQTLAIRRSPRPLRRRHCAPPPGCGAVTVAQVEQAAVPIPARTNGSAKPGPPAPLLVAPAPEQSVVARAEAAALADPGLTTAEKVCALTPEACRWPCGDPGHPDFHFCGSPVARRPYCEHHRAMAYVAPLTGSGHGARIGLVAHGWRSPTTKRLSTGVSTRASTDPVGGSVDRSVDESIAAQAQDFRAL